MWTRQKGARWIGPNGDSFIYKSLPFFLSPFELLFPSTHCSVIWILEQASRPATPESLGSGIEVLALLSSPRCHPLRLSFPVSPYLPARTSSSHVLKRLAVPSIPPSALGDG